MAKFHNSLTVVIRPLSSCLIEPSSHFPINAACTIETRNLFTQVSTANMKIEVQLTSIACCLVAVFAKVLSIIIITNNKLTGYKLTVYTPVVVFHVNNFFCEQENAHFSISEALIAAIEQVRMNIY